jgi:hypothetical protein
MQLTTTEHGFALLDGAAEMGRTGLTLSRDLTFDEWTRLGVAMQRVESGLQWALGDWINYGEHRHGEKYAQAVEETGYAAQTLTNFAWVASRIEISRRRENLSFGHHAEVAALESDEQDKVLETADVGHWSRAAVREAVRTFKAQLTGGTPMPEPKRELPVRVVVNQGGLDNPRERDDDDLPDGSARDDTDEHAPNPIAEWERAEKELEQARAEIERLTVDDKDRELRKLSAEVAGMNARLNGLLNEKKAAVEQAQYGEKKLREVRKALGVERDREILDAIAALRQKVA